MKTLVRLLLPILLAAGMAACSDFGSSAANTERAREAIVAGELDVADIELRNALQKDPDNAEARMLLGSLLLTRGEILPAEKELQLARSLGAPETVLVPMLAQVLYPMGSFDELQALPYKTLKPADQALVLASQGLAHLGNGSLDKAQEKVDLALEMEPTSVFARVARARLVAARAEPDLARKQLQELLQEHPEDSGAWSLLGDVELGARDFEKAEAAYQKAIEYGTNPLAERLKRAMILLEQRKFDDAQQEVTILLTKAPQHPGINYAQGLIHYNNQDFEAASLAFAVAELDKRRYPLALYYASTAHYSLGNMDQATGYAQQFHSLFPSSPAGRKLLATLRLNERDFAATEALARPVVEQQPDDVVAMNLLANALLAQGNTDEAIDLLNRVAELLPESSTAQLRLGAGLLMRGDDGAGVERVESAIAINPKFQQADILLALNYLRKGEVEAAIAAAEDYRKRNPVSVTPYNLLGRIYLVANDPESANKQFNKALSIAPGDPGANHNLAAAAIQAGDYDSARTHYQAVLAEHKNHLATLIKQAELASRQNDEEAVVATLEQAIEAHPEAFQPRVILARYYLAKGKAELVATVLGELKTANQDIPSVLLELARADLAQKNYSEARLTLTQLLELAPRNTVGYLLLANAESGLGNADASLGALNSALEIDPANLSALLGRARIEYSRGNLAAMESDLVILREKAPGNPGVLRLDAIQARASGKMDQASKSFEQLFAAQPTSENMLTLSAQKQSTGDAKGALVLRELWVKEHPDDVSARMALGASYSGLDRVDDAIAQYQAVLALQADNFPALNNLAWYLQETNVKQAVEYAERAVALQPESAEALDTLAMGQLRSREVSRATRSISRAIDTGTENPTIHFHSAQIAIAAGDKQSARRTLSKLVERGIDFPEMEQARKLLAQL